MKRIADFVLLGSALLIAGCCANHHVKKWEYMQRYGAQSDATLNQWADQGWILVTIVGGEQPIYVLKRLKK